MVRDQSGRPITAALVVLDPGGARVIVRTDSTGKVAVEHVREGTYELSTMAIAYRTDIRSILVPPAGLDVDIELRINSSILDTMHILARRTGVHGVVITKDLHPLAGAKVQMIGPRGVTSKTDPQGRFDMPEVSHGAYVAYVTHAGHVSRLLSIVVPRDSALDLAIALDAGTSGSGKLLAMPLSEFDRRTRWMVGGNRRSYPVRNWPRIKARSSGMLCDTR